MSNIFLPSITFDSWLHGFKCYDKYLSERGSFARRVFYPFWLSQCSFEDVCSRCFGCSSGLDSVIVDYPFEEIPTYEQTVNYR